LSRGQPWVVLDNTVLSSLHVAGALARVLEIRPANWIVPLQVRREAVAWKTYGAVVGMLLDDLQARDVLVYASPELGPEAALFAQVSRTRGQGESAAIAIAYHRRGVIATDDRQARRTCQSLRPSVPTLSTEGLLSTIVVDGLLSLAEAQAIWAATGIRDPRRGVHI
jgi:predicted nucleic acid-binding protein